MQQTAIILTIAVLGPVLGSLAGILLPPGEALLNRLLSFAAGTMLAISFLELLPESIRQSSVAGCAAGLFVGLLAMMALHSLLPEIPVGKEGGGRGQKKNTALLMVAAIMLHNLPEGIAMSAGSEGGTMLLIAAAIATHDIPEGICTAAPYYYATGRRAAAFGISVSTALPTLLGFWAGKRLLSGLHPFTMGIITGCIAGLMIAISCDELIPAEPGKGRTRAMPALMVGIIFVLLLRQAMR